MYSLNRKTRYEIIRELIKKANPDIIKELVINSGFYELVTQFGFSIDSNTDDVEYRKLELLNYLEEMEKCWTDNYKDMTDRQYIKIKK